MKTLLALLLACASALAQDFTFTTPQNPAVSVDAAITLNVAAFGTGWRTDLLCHTAVLWDCGQNGSAVLQSPHVGNATLTFTTFYDGWWYQLPTVSGATLTGTAVASTCGPGQWVTTTWTYAATGQPVSITVPASRGLVLDSVRLNVVSPVSLPWKEAIDMEFMED